MTIIFKNHKNTKTFFVKNYYIFVFDFSDFVFRKEEKVSIFSVIFKNIDGKKSEGGK